MAFMWICSIYIRTFMYFYASVIGIAQILKIKDHRPLILPLGMIIIVLSQIVHPNIVHSNNYNKEVWPLFSSVIAILLPLLLLFIAKFRKIKPQETDNQSKNESPP